MRRSRRSGVTDLTEPGGKAAIPLKSWRIGSKRIDALRRRTLVTRALRSQGLWLTLTYLFLLLLLTRPYI